MALLILLSVIFGLCIGSFLNVVILRGAKNESFFGRSYCVSCRKTLSWTELIPLLSFAIQKGKCRSCGISLFWQYPLVEAGTAFSFAAATWYIFSYQTVVTGSFLYLLLITIFAWTTVSVAMVILVADFKYYLIPDGAVFTLGAVGLVASFLRVSLSSWLPLQYDLSAAIFFAIFFAAIWFFSKGTWMGFGDVKLVLATSLLVGFPASIAAVLFAFWSGALAGGLLIVLRLKSLKNIVPFGPFILLGALLAFSWGETFLQWSGLTDLLLYL